MGFLNYINLLTSDEVFMQYVLPNTVKYALIVGVGGYGLSFLLAWALANLTKWPRTILALILYSPSMTAGVAMSVLWKIMFTGDQTGYINSWLMEIGIINNPKDGVKILGNGELTKKLNVKANAFSESAVEKIKALGGNAEVI